MRVKRNATDTKTGSALWPDGVVLASSTIKAKSAAAILKSEKPQSKDTAIFGKTNILGFSRFSKPQKCKFISATKVRLSVRAARFTRHSPFSSTSLGVPLISDPKNALYVVCSAYGTVVPARQEKFFLLL
jgi:hypothetical protein